MRKETPTSLCSAVFLYYIHSGYKRPSRRTTFMTPTDASPDLFTPAMFHILLVLAGHDCHGYGIMQEVAEQSGGQVRLAPGTLYRSIKQLVTMGMIVECDERPDHSIDDERRRYYQ